MKVAIIGAGRVGVTAAYTLIVQGVVNYLALIDQNQERARGEVLDIIHGAPLLPPTSISYGNISAAEGADLVIISAGIPRQPGESRLELAQKNAGLIRRIMEELNLLRSVPLVLVVTNPVDVMTHVAMKAAKNSRVFGLGCVMDSLRYRSLLGTMLRVSPANVDAMILGEHGDSMVPMLSVASVQGIPLQQMPGWDEEKYNQVVEQTRTGGAEVIKLKGGTYYSVALAICQVARAIERDSREILPVTSFCPDYMGLGEVTISRPALVGRQGIISYPSLRPSPEEMEQLRTSAQVIQKYIQETDNA
jgi:L-lactate dehydrogenase